MMETRLPKSIKDFAEGFEWSKHGYLSEDRTRGFYDTRYFDRIHTELINLEPESIEPYPGDEEVAVVVAAGQEQYFRHDWLVDAIDAFGEDSLRVYRHEDSMGFPCKFIVDEHWVYLIAPRVDVGG